MTTTNTLAATAAKHLSLGQLSQLKRGPEWAIDLVNELLAEIEELEGKVEQLLFLG